MVETVLAGARVKESVLRSAKRVLQAEGMSVSLAIQNLMTVTAATGSVPECIKLPDAARLKRRSQLDALMRRLETRPHIPWDESISDRDVLDEERMRRFG